MSVILFWWSEVVIDGLDSCEPTHPTDRKHLNLFSKKDDSEMDKAIAVQHAKVGSLPCGFSMELVLLGPIRTDRKSSFESSCRVSTVPSLK